MNLQSMREQFKVPMPPILKQLALLEFKEGKAGEAKKDQTQLAALFPKSYGQCFMHASLGREKTSQPQKVGVVLSGGQAAGGHNVICALYDALKELHPESRLFGFLGGPSGIIQGKYCELSSEQLQRFRNQGGFDLIGSGRTKIETEEQFASSLKNVQTMGLTGLVIIGGDDSNTNAALLAEYFLKNGCSTSVVGVPKTIDGDLKSEDIAVSFGFDTASKTYAEMIGNIARDARSAKKYYHFIKLMGRSASHIALECALLCRPNLCFIGEEVAAKKMTLQKIVQSIVELIQARASKGKEYGVILIPEGLIEFIPEVKALIAELNALPSLQMSEVSAKISQECLQLFSSLPERIQRQLLLDRDPHGNVQLSQIETEQLLIEMVRKQVTLNAVAHFFGYEGRAGYPTNFDATYCSCLGRTAAALIDAKLTGYITCIGSLYRPVDEWQAMGIPLTSLLILETRKGKIKPVIEKALVALQGRAFEEFAKKRSSWAFDDDYGYPGPIQFFGPSEITDKGPYTLYAEGSSC